MSNFGPMEIAIVAIVALLVLGPKRLPETGRSLGRGLREFKESIGGRADEHDEVALVATVSDARRESENRDAGADSPNAGA